MELISIADALFEKPYLWDRHGTYQSGSQKVIVKIRNQWYDIPKRQPTSTVAMISIKQTKKLINHAQKLAFIMITPQNSRKNSKSILKSKGHYSILETIRIINPPLSNLVICLNHESCLNQESIQSIFSH